MAQTQADRQAAAKKAAATRERNRIREESSVRGSKAASSRQRHNAGDELRSARRSASTGASHFTNAAKSIGNAAVEAGKSVVTLGGVLTKD
ncbi:MAG: hypothetical protein QOG62_35 [Thermoleophilaceae bacterium]|nr:hypothetical protein [Thermoleophilaceae bacterium]